MELWNKYETILEKNGIDTPLRKAHFFGQGWVESQLKPRRENLNYSVEALLSKFGRHRITEEQARKYGRTATQKANQVELANILYGGEWGKKNLGNIQKNDAYIFRGAGFFQITGRANFEKLSKDTGIDFVNNPDLFNEEANSFIAAIWFWNDRKLNQYADKDDSLSVSKVINLGSVKVKGTPFHAKERKEATEKYKKLIK